MAHTRTFFPLCVQTPALRTVGWCEKQIRPPLVSRHSAVLSSLLSMTLWQTLPERTKLLVALVMCGRDLHTSLSQKSPQTLLTAPPKVDKSIIRILNSLHNVLIFQTKKSKKVFWERVCTSTDCSPNGGAAHPLYDITWHYMKDAWSKVFQLIN